MTHPQSQPDIDDLLSDLTDTLKPQGELRALCLKAAEVIAQLRHPQSGVQTGDAELWARETDAEFARLTGIIFDLYKPLSELVVAYQDADSPAMQDTIKRARAALAPPSAMRVGGISLAEPEPPTTTLTSQQSGRET